ncbi:MAG: DUF6174 domain-containing protein [Pirellulales bacterium]
MSHPEPDASGLPRGDAADDGQRPFARRGDRSPVRMLLIGLLTFGAVLVAIFVALEVFVARRIPELTTERLAAAHELWQRQGPPSYDLDIQIEGARPGPVHVEVRNGDVVAVSINGQPPSAWTWDTWTVAGQFETLERELLVAEDPVHQLNAESGTTWRLRCEFDTQFGFPRRFQRTVFGGQPNASWHVTDFVVR